MPPHGARGRARGEEEDEEDYAKGQTTPPPNAAATVYYPLTDDEGGGLAAGERPPPLVEVRPQGQLGRHTGIGYELVLNPVLPPLGGGEEVPEVRAAAFSRAVDGDDEDMRQLAEASRTSQARRKRKKRRGKTPTSSSSALLSPESSWRSGYHARVRG